MEGTWREDSRAVQSSLFFCSRKYRGTTQNVLDHGGDVHVRRVRHAGLAAGPILRSRRKSTGPPRRKQRLTLPLGRARGRMTIRWDRAPWRHLMARARATTSTGCALCSNAGRSARMVWYCWCAARLQCLLRCISLHFPSAELLGALARMGKQHGRWARPQLPRLSAAVKRGTAVHGHTGTTRTQTYTRARTHTHFNAIRTPKHTTFRSRQALVVNVLHNSLALHVCAI